MRIGAGPGSAPSRAIAARARAEPEGGEQSRDERLARPRTHCGFHSASARGHHRPGEPAPGDEPDESGTHEPRDRRAADPPAEVARGDQLVGGPAQLAALRTDLLYESFGLSCHRRSSHSKARVRGKSRDPDPRRTWKAMR